MPVPPLRTVCLVSCAGKKTSHPSMAQDLYLSAWFLKARGYALSLRVPWFILSAHYGLLHPDKAVEPYDKTLLEMPRADRVLWARGVDASLGVELPRLGKAVFLAGARYREFLAPLLEGRGVRCEVPMRGLAIGKQLGWLICETVGRRARGAGARNLRGGGRPGGVRSGRGAGR